MTILALNNAPSSLPFLVGRPSDPRPGQRVESVQRRWLLGLRSGPARFPHTCRGQVDAAVAGRQRSLVNRHIHQPTYPPRPIRHVENLGARPAASLEATSSVSPSVGQPGLDLGITERPQLTRVAYEFVDACTQLLVAHDDACVRRLRTLAPDVVLQPDGLVRVKPVEGVDALIELLVAHREQYGGTTQSRPQLVATAVDEEHHAVHFVHEFCLKDMGRPGRPATFRFLRGHRVGIVEVDADGRVPRVWTRRPLTFEEREVLLDDAVHCYPAALPADRVVKHSSSATTSTADPAGSPASGPAGSGLDGGHPGQKGHLADFLSGTRREESLAAWAAAHASADVSSGGNGDGGGDSGGISAVDAAALMEEGAMLGVETGVGLGFAVGSGSGGGGGETLAASKTPRIDEETLAPGCRLLDGYGIAEYTRKPVVEHRRFLEGAAEIAARLQTVHDKYSVTVNVLHSAIAADSNVGFSHWRARLVPRPGAIPTAPATTAATIPPANASGGSQQTSAVATSVPAPPTPVGSSSSSSSALPKALTPIDTITASADGDKVMAVLPHALTPLDTDASVSVDATSSVDRAFAEVEASITPAAEMVTRAAAAAAASAGGTTVTIGVTIATGGTPETAAVTPAGGTPAEPGETAAAAGGTAAAAPAAVAPGGTFTMPGGSTWRGPTFVMPKLPEMPKNMPQLPKHMMQHLPKNMPQLRDVHLPHMRDMHLPDMHLPGKEDVEKLFTEMSDAISHMPDYLYADDEAGEEEARRAKKKFAGVHEVEGVDVVLFGEDGRITDVWSLREPVGCERDALSGDQMTGGALF